MKSSKGLAPEPNEKVLFAFELGVEPVPTPVLPESYSVSDLMRVGGLTYRQIHDWARKGALTASRDGEVGWRKFTPREFFAILVCSAIRRQFGVPIEKLAFVQSFMLKDGVDHLQLAMEKMCYGLVVWLMTDLSTSFIMDSDIEFGDLFDLGYFRYGDDDAEGIVFLPINPLVNQLLMRLDDPYTLQPSPEVYDRIYRGRARTHVGTVEEFEVLEAIRNRSYKKVVVKLDNGRVMDFSTEVERTDKGRAMGKNELWQIIASRRYQTVTVTMHDGRAVRVNQTIPKASAGDKGRPRSKRRTPTSRS